MSVAAALSAASAAALTLVLTPPVRALALRLSIVDVPSPRKVHAQSTPYLGGVAIAAGALVPVAVAAPGRLVVPCVVAVALGVMGLVDDVRPVPGWSKFVVITGGAAILWAGGVRAEVFGSPALDALLTWGWYAGITNAVNFLDNMDGLASGVTAIAGLALASIAVLASQPDLAVAAAGAGGAALAFLRYNRQPATVFMGDAGSSFLGSMIASLGLLLRVPGLGRWSLVAAAGVLCVPILDTSVISLSRISRRMSPLTPGLDHVSHRLSVRGLSKSRAVSVLWAAAAVSAAVAVPSAARGWLVPLLALLACAAVAGVWLLSVDPNARA